MFPQVFGKRRREGRDGGDSAPAPGALSGAELPGQGSPAWPGVRSLASPATASPSPLQRPAAGGRRSCSAPGRVFTPV